MKQFLTIIALFIFISSYSQSDTSSSTLQEAVKEAIAEDKTLTEEDLLNMYGADTNKQFQKMQAEMDKVLKQQEEAEESAKLKREIALFFSLLIAFFPAISVFRLVRKKKLQVGDRSNIIQAILVLILGGAVLFAFNYFMIWMSLTHGNKFYAIGAVVLMILFAGWAIWQYFRKPDNPQQKQ